VQAPQSPTSVKFRKVGGSAASAPARPRAGLRAMSPNKSWRERYEIHPAAAALPMLSDAEIAELGDDIVENGLREPIVEWVDNTAEQNGDNSSMAPRYLLDGRNREEAMEPRGLNVKTVRLNGKAALAKGVVTLYAWEKRIVTTADGRVRPGCSNGARTPAVRRTMAQRSSRRGQGGGSARIVASGSQLSIRCSPLSNSSPRRGCRRDERPQFFLPPRADTGNPRRPHSSRSRRSPPRSEVNQ
jgi:hypothetical protein